jgi:hypothetical protein
MIKLPKIPGYRSVAKLLTMAICLSPQATIRAQDDLSPSARNAQANALDPTDYQFVKQVCTVCHGPNMFLHSHTWSQWSAIFDQMNGYGARATPEQWQHIEKYFQKSLTLIDINHADEDALSLLLGVDQTTAVAIVVRRADKKFSTVDELEAVPGIDKKKIEQLRPRILFEPPPDD